MRFTNGWIAVALLAFASFASIVIAQTPEIGSKAPDFMLSAPDGQAVRLSDLTRQGGVVLIVLRGFPGYQCPYCQKQVHDFQLHADKFAALGTQVLMVYPGPPADLDKRAKEFMAKQDVLPANFHLVIDPDYGFTNQYGLRWNAPNETAYPSTFLVDRDRVVFFRKISHSHGDRSSAEDVLAELKARISNASH